MISQELLKLSYADRNAINEEIHGVKCLAVEESPALLTQSLEAFQLLLNSLPPSRKEAYDRIVRLRNQNMPNMASTLSHRTRALQWRDLPSPQMAPYLFVDDGTFRLRFLRCELFNVEKAVIRFINYLDTSFDFFGPAALAGVVRIKDLAKSQLRFIRRGHVQVLPYRDRAGRCVVVSLGSLGADIDQMEWIKTFFFIGDSVTRDSVESQQKGVVYVGDVTSKKNRQLAYSSPEHYPMLKKVLQALPSRLVAIHSCWPASFGTRILTIVDNLVKILTRSQFATRVRLEKGTEIELRYKLRGYGIPIHLLPLTKTGVIKIKYFSEWIRIRKVLEESSAEAFSGNNNALYRVVVIPALADVVFRQGTPSMKNPGNVTFRDAMLSHLEQNHLKASNEEGSRPQPEETEDVCSWLIDTVEQNNGGRFLEWDKNFNVWVKMIDRQKLRMKVTIVYRDVSKRFLNRRQEIADAQQIDDDVDRGEGGSYSFVEGGQDGNALCGTTNMGTRSDSNYSETSDWF